MSDRYLEQYERVKRWFTRFEEINDGKTHDRHSDYYQDEVYAFFQNCYHLKDWVIQSEVIPKEKVEDFINQSTELRICADLCNGSKHLQLNRTRTGDDSTDITARHYDFSVSEKRISVHYYVVSDNKKYDAFSLATSCIKEWYDFLKLEQLVE